MIVTSGDNGKPLRDGTETLPEPLDIAAYEGAPSQDQKTEAENLLDEALLESFPASDPPASGHMTPDLHSLTKEKDQSHG